MPTKSGIPPTNRGWPADFEEALGALLGKDAGGHSASTIARLKDAWSDEHVRWSKRDLIDTVGLEFTTGTASGAAC